MKNFFAPLILLSLLIYGCSSKTTIADIFNNPRDYVDKEVVIKGRVTEAEGLILFSYFTINDGTGEIRVITGKPLPQKGKELKVSGKVLYFAFGEESILVIEENMEK